SPTDSRASPPEPRWRSGAAARAPAAAKAGRPRPSRRVSGADLDPSLVDLTRRLAAGDPTARAELARQPGEMARALAEKVTVLERRPAPLTPAPPYFD